MAAARLIRDSRLFLSGDRGSSSRAGGSPFGAGEVAAGPKTRRSFCRRGAAHLSPQGAFSLVRATGPGTAGSGDSRSRGQPERRAAGRAGMRLQERRGERGGVLLRERRRERHGGGPAAKSEPAPKKGRRKKAVSKRPGDGRKGGDPRRCNLERSNPERGDPRRSNPRRSNPRRGDPRKRRPKEGR